MNYRVMVKQWDQMAYHGHGAFRTHTHSKEDSYEAALREALVLGRGWHRGEPRPIQVWVEDDEA